MTDRILIVDDEPANVALLNEALTRAGYEHLRPVTDPRDAVGAFEAFLPDLVLLDLNMPHLDGFEVLRRFKALIGDSSFLPVLVLTADTSPDVKERALMEGATDFLTKPFDLLEVELRAKNLLETRALYVRLKELNRDLDDRVKERTRALEAAFQREKELNDRLKELDRLRDALLLAVSHEVRTPLTVITAVSEMLEEADTEPIPPDQLSDVGTMLAGASLKLQRLLGGVLDIDRLRRGVREPLREPIDLSSAVDGVVRAVKMKTHSLEVNVEPVEAELDPAQFERIVESLLDNAVQHTPPGTPIWLSVRPVDSGILVGVDDAGPGIPNELKESIFESFAQRDTEEYQPGLGLGLSLVAQFAKLHGGRAWVEDRPGGGAAFRAWLPA